ncbi:MAG: hypothetical protein H6565_11355 [Lewinellaceae bacterium]|nr:hypothetical protein [Saprospiraceae bacterium]MCB9307180.1 hypothetical protein [Lewinellaceae bacterium]
MSDTKRIRELIGENEMEIAIRLTIELLEKKTGSADLLDSAILQKSRWVEYKRKNISGLGEDKEINGIRAAVLNICRELDHRAEKGGSQPDSQQGYTPPPKPPQFDSPQTDSTQKQYTARCFFNNDPNSYYVTPTNQIIMVNPLTNFSTIVANRVASVNPNFAWVYLFPNSFFYNVDHAGAIWGVNAFGMPVEMGYVQYL